MMMMMMMRSRAYKNLPTPSARARVFGPKRCGAGVSVSVSVVVCTCICVCVRGPLAQIQIQMMIRVSVWVWVWMSACRAFLRTREESTQEQTSFRAVVATSDYTLNVVVSWRRRASSSVRFDSSSCVFCLRAVSSESQSPCGCCYVSGYHSYSCRRALHPIQIPMLGAICYMLDIDVDIQHRRTRYSLSGRWCMLPHLFLDLWHTPVHECCL